MRFACVALAVTLASVIFGDSGLEQLQNGPGPKFRDGHTLLPLSTWGPEFTLEVRKELCEHWGYCLQFGRLRPQLVEQLDDPESVVSRVCELAQADPDAYPLHVITAPAFSIRLFADDLPPDTWCRDAEGNLIDDEQVYSPEAPDETFEMIADFEVQMLREVLQKAPIAVLTNGGEYALSVLGHHQKYWERDPKVIAARGERDWLEYISERKAHQEMIITGKLRELVPERRLYIYYHTEASHHRNRYDGWWRWVWDYKYTRPVSDIPNTSIYWKHYNTGWSGEYDMLTMALNSTAQHLAVGQPLSYNWMNAGWPGEKRPDPPVSDPEHYLGYLKCYYAAGMIGGVAGYFAYDDPESWIWQLMCLGRVHALFSHLEDFLRNGDLLPGPEKHAWSGDLPAYEFPTQPQGARVVARKHRERDEWLIVAWTAQEAALDVGAEIPVLGEIELQARPSGAVYRAQVVDGRAQLSLVDENGLLPTQSL
jgi:hypothetical protein